VTCVFAQHPTLDLKDWTKTLSPGLASLYPLRTEKRRWFFGENNRELRAASALENAATLRRPVLLVAPPGALSTSDDDLNALRQRLKAAGNEASIILLDRKTPHTQQFGATQVAIEAFLEKHLVTEKR
jgi:hypothetical protein